MKKTLLTLLTVAGLSLSAAAQNSAVTNAILNQRNGLLDKARTDIDKAIVNEKTSGKAKTWFYRGEIYEQLAASPIYGKALAAGEGTRTAFDSYQKAMTLEGKDSEFGKQAAAKVDNLYGAAFNAGVESYNAKDYDKAIANYKMASQIRPADTTAVLYSAYAAESKAGFLQQQSNKYLQLGKSAKGDSTKIYSDLVIQYNKDARNTNDVARASYKQLLGMNYKSASLYSRLLQMARQEKDEKAAAEVIQQALAAYPTNKQFMLEELNMYLSAGRGKEAIDKIQKALAADPKNSNLYAVLGSVYDQNKQPELALAAYKSAVEADPNNFDAQYNLGVYNYNRAADFYTRASKMSLAVYQKSGKALEVQGKKYFQDSVPYFEKALQLQPEDRNSLTSLQKVYFRLGRTADSERLNAKLQSMKK